MSSLYLIVLFLGTLITSAFACILSHKVWEVTFILISLVPLLASTYRTCKNIQNPDKVARELKFTAIGCAIHHIAWMVVLTLDFWFYY